MAAADMVSLVTNSFEHSVNLHVPSSLASSQHYWGGLTSCNGLVCLADHRGINIYLWNPSTRQCCKVLPYPKVPSDKWAWAFIRFYFDSVSNDYKILRIVVSSKFTVRVELYSINSNTWREIKVDNEGLASMVSFGPVIKGALYTNCSDELISFQLRNEMFKTVPLPGTELRVVFNNRSSVFDYQGRVGLILHCHDDETLSLWSLDEDDGSGVVSWTKNLNFETGFRIDWTTTFLGDGKLVTSENGKRIILYDDKTKEIKKFQHPTWHYVKSPHKYTESFVSVKGFDKY